MTFKFVCFHCPITARAQYSMFFYRHTKSGESTLYSSLVFYRRAVTLQLINQSPSFMLQAENDSHPSQRSRIKRVLLQTEGKCVASVTSQTCCRWEGVPYI